MESITQNSDAAVRFYRVTAVVGEMSKIPWKKYLPALLTLPLAITIPFSSSKLRGFLKLFTKLFMKLLIIKTLMAINFFHICVKRV